MPNNDDINRQLLNSSGFPFQLRVAEEIKRNPGPRSWRVFAEEHFWRDAETEASGFIDLIAGFGIIRWVIECKRGADVTWQFLTRSTDAERVTRAKLLCTDKMGNEPNGRLWSDLQAIPDSAEAAFCVVKGQADKEPMLERIAANLLQSVEALADEELALPAPEGVGHRRLYQPVIVTAATLSLCRFDPTVVGLDDGKVPDSGGATFQEVPFIRFRKALSGSRRSEAQDLESAQRENERTVLVIQAKSLRDLLEYWDVSPGRGEEWPQTVQRQRIRLARESGTA
jgi:hypothetical protein